MNYQFFSKKRLTFQNGIQKLLLNQNLLTIMISLDAIFLDQDLIIYGREFKVSLMLVLKN